MGSTRRQDNTTEKQQLSRRVAMFRNAASGVWQTVAADEYDSDVHTELKCGDAACPAGVVHVDAHYAEGSYQRSAHFASKNREDHIENCRWLAPEFELHANSVTLKEAIAKNYKIIINLNWPMGNNLFNSMGRASDVHTMGTHYNNFKSTHVHATLRARSLEEFYEVVSKIKAEEAAALQTNRMLPPVMPRTYVSHAQDIRYIDNFLIGGAPQKYSALIDEMEKRGGLFMKLGKFDVQSFARNFLFESKDDERKHLDTPGQIIDAKPIKIAQRGNAKLYVALKLKSDDEAFRPKMLGHTAYEVVGVPTVLMMDITKAKSAFNAGGIGYIPLYVQVNTEGQYQPAKGSSVIVRPHPRLQF